MGTKKLNGYDAVIVGGGPCGCVLAKDLALAGKKVILIEKGGNNLKGIGSMMGMLNGQHMETGGGVRIFPSTLEGQNIVLGTGMGGGSYLYAGIAGMPLFNQFDEFDIDLRPHLEDAKKESWVNKTPDSFIGPTSKRMMEVGNSIGLPFEPADRHIKFVLCKYACKEAMFGCRRDAKWMGYYAAQEAEDNGAHLQIHTKVHSIIVENGEAVGVHARGIKDKQNYEIRGKTVICTSGGTGTAAILMRSGVKNAGQTLFGDPSFGSWGVLPKNGLKSHFYEHGTAISYMDDENGLLFSTMVTFPRIFWAGYQLAESGIGGFLDVYKNYPMTIAIFNKIHDEGVGRITCDEHMSKVTTPKDREKMNYCRNINNKLLVAMGCNPNEIRQIAFDHFKGGMTYGHPGGSCPVGVVVNSNLETEIKNCFVCDISALPGAPSRPPMLTLVTLTKWFVPRLLKMLN